MAPKKKGAGKKKKEEKIQGLPPPTVQEYRRLGHACARCDVKAVDYLLRVRECLPGAFQLNRLYPIQICVRECLDHDEHGVTVLRMLLKYKADVNARDKKLEEKKVDSKDAKKGGKPAGKEQPAPRAIDIPTAGFSLAADGGTALHIAAKRRRLSAIRVLLEAQHDRSRTPDERLQIDPRDVHDKTPLIYAACVGHARIVQELITAKANPALRDNRGRTAFMYAAQIGDDKVCAVLEAADKTLQNANDREGDDASGLLLKCARPGLYAPPDAVRVALLLRDHTNPGFLTLGVRARDVGGVRRLLDDRCKIDSAEPLLECAEIVARGAFPLQPVVEIAALLTGAKAWVDRAGVGALTPLHITCGAAPVQQEHQSAPYINPHEHEGLLKEVEEAEKAKKKDEGDDRLGPPPPPGTFVEAEAKARARALGEFAKVLIAADADTSRQDARGLRPVEYLLIDIDRLGVRNMLQVIDPTYRVALQAGSPMSGKLRPGGAKAMRSDPETPETVSPSSKLWTTLQDTMSPGGPEEVDDDGDGLDEGEAVQLDLQAEVLEDDDEDGVFDEEILAFGKRPPSASSSTVPGSARPTSAGGSLAATVSRPQSARPPTRPQSAAPDKAGGRPQSAYAGKQ